MIDYDEEEQEPLPTYTRSDAIQFVEDMLEADLIVEHYHGRFFWHGPAVRVNNLQEALTSHSDARIAITFWLMTSNFMAT